MNAYSPIWAGQFARSSRTGHRRLLFGLLFWYDIVATSITLAIVILIVAPLVAHNLLLLGWPALYAAYAGLRLAAIYRASLQAVAAYVVTHVPGPGQERVRIRFEAARDRVLPVWKQWVTLWETSRWFSRLFAIALVLGTMAFIVTISRADASANRAMGDVAVWLLFIPPIRLTAQKDTIQWILGISALAILADAIASLLAANQPLALLLSKGIVRLVGIQSLWLMLICLLPLILSRYLSDREAGLNVAIEVVQEIAGLHHLHGKEFANAAAATIARQLGFDEVNILLAIARDDAVGEGLRMIGAASANGRELVDEGFALWWGVPASVRGVGITSWAANHKTVCLVNDISRDPQQRYRAHPKFGRTRAELAIPIVLGETLLGVLDVQSERPYTFSADDVNILQVITTHLAVALDNAQNLAQARGIYTISQSIAKRLLLQRELRPALEGIVRVAREVLRADHVVLYPYDELHARYEEPVSDGVLNSASVATAARINAVADTAVARMMLADGPHYVVHGETEADQSTTKAISLVPRPDSFVKRTGVQSTAAIPLRLPSASDREGRHACLGVIFVNYLQRRTFTPEYRAWCSALADLSALALQNAILYEQVAQEERRNLWREVHDGMAQYASYGRMLLDQVVDAYTKLGALNDADAKKLELAKTCSHKLQQQVNYLVGICNDSTARLGLFDELDEYAAIVQRTLGIRCESTHTGSDCAVSPKVQHEVRMAIREAVHNATRHGLASMVSITAQAGDTNLAFVVADNGVGFDLHEATSTGGLSNIRFRIAERLNGTVWIDSQPGRGTLISAIIPLCAAAPRIDREAKPPPDCCRQDDQEAPALVRFHMGTNH